MRRFSIRAICLTLACAGLLAAQESNRPAASSASSNSQASSQPDLDVLTIVRRSVDRDATNFDRYRDYTYTETSTQYRYDKSGNLSADSTESETNEILMLAGEPYSRLIARDGVPISEKDARKEQEKLDKELARRLKDPGRQAKYEKDRTESRRFLREIPEAFNFTLLSEETLDGLPVWKIHAEPKPGFKPRDSRANNLAKVRGTIWIDQAGYQWVKAEIEVIDTISWGFFVLRIPPGATVSFAQTRVNQEVWMPASIKMRADARIAMLKTIHAGFEITYSNYRKFQADSKVVGAEEVPPQPER